MTSIMKGGTNPAQAHALWKRSFIPCRNSHSNGQKQYAFTTTRPPDRAPATSGASGLRVRRFAGTMTSTERAKLILVVNADDTLRSQYTFGLTFAGFAVSEARSGLEALQKIESRRPDLVILDSTLQGIDAGAVRAELASNPHTRHIPVIVLTATGDGFSLAMDGCCVLQKPLATWRVIEAVARCLDGSACGQ